MSVPQVLLNNGVEIPQIGMGVWRVPAARAREVVARALELGYRHVDTASLYGNEEGVGQAVRESGLDRDAVFVTSKVWNDDQGYDATLRAFDTSMAKLGFEVLDLYLIHWPAGGRGLTTQTWRALERLYLDGRVRAIGVSNFEPHHLQRLLDRVEVVPAVNQVELHPYLQQHEVRAANAAHGIVTEAWSPLAKGGELLGDPVITRIARKHERTPAQVVLRWHLDHDTVVIPKSVTPSRMEENLDALGFELDEEDLRRIDGLDRGLRVGPHPDHVA
ncbi:aldo/keto reductase [Nocardioides mesophilus]|uniref:Aldo/keto reductase n=1 Tax=Nocardioides mesophilus TaxID=433659 RepID=A0A7G9RB66_9ACTN|nr:aldo/keto reductase [Nocardioides mesophilus]QNN52841.1 aldo/keto reductase [Nocardioides mesophilus]